MFLAVTCSTVITVHPTFETDLHVPLHPPEIPTTEQSTQGAAELAPLETTEGQDELSLEPMEPMDPVETMEAMEAVEAMEAPGEQLREEAGATAPKEQKEHMHENEQAESAALTNVVQRC
eukprot:Skav211018  [mRNA]  locus=scaffold610:22869:27703:- [translate_table: standard]